MPKTDLTTTVVDGSKDLLSRVRTRVKRRIFAGPGVLVLSPKEALSQFKALSPEDRLKLYQDMGPDAFMSYVDNLLEGKPNG